MNVATATRATMALAACRSLRVTYVSGETRVEALRDVDLQIAANDHMALLGRSGSGKTTLLHALGGLIVPTSGSVTWKGEPLSTLDAAARRRARARGIAYVFQGANLLPSLTAWENIAFAARVAVEREDRPAPSPGALLRLVGLTRKGDALPAELSGGESQRVAVARALAQRPELLLCDEPTGQLDSDTGARVLDMIEALQRELGFALVIATHDADVAARAERVAQLAGDGPIES
jgi:putative ABC transport system ATP-binding protein